MTYSREENQVLALAAIFQAALSADELATRGRCDPEPTRALMESVLVLDEAGPERVFPEPAALRPGLELVTGLLRQGQQREHMRAVSYALALMHLANRLRKSSDLTAILRHRLEALKAQRPHFDDAAAVEFCHRVAGIYVDTLGSFNFRIRVQGEPMHLQNDDTAARIRALFLAGVRAAFLWRQAGGRRWHLLLRRRPLAEAAESLIRSI